MNENLNKFENKWLLSIVREDPYNTKWFLSSPDEINEAICNFDLEKLSGLAFKEARALLKVSHMVYNTPEKNSLGLPLLSVYAHKKYNIME